MKVTLWQRTNSASAAVNHTGPVHRPMFDILEDRLAPAVITVNSTADAVQADNQLTLREAILLVDGTLNKNQLSAAEAKLVKGQIGAGQRDKIVFNIPGDGPHTIEVTGAGLPTITKPVEIDGYSQPGASPNTQPLSGGDDAKLMIELTPAAAANAAAVGLTVAGGDSIISGLVINAFGGGQVLLKDHGNNSISGNFIGTDPLGDAGKGKAFGVKIDDVADNLIGSRFPEGRNVISGAQSVENGPDGIGVWVTGLGATNNKIRGNIIGADAKGTTAVPNEVGITLEDGAFNTEVGGRDAGAGNLISGNVREGLLLSDTADVRIFGNLIGTDASGSKPLPNTSYGIYVVGSTGNQIGGASGGRNVISGNGLEGIIFDKGSFANTVQGNYIGLDQTGERPLGNGNPNAPAESPGAGISLVNGAHDNLVGGRDAKYRNVISANATFGIEILASPDNTIQGNYIGTDQSGELVLAPDGQSLGNRVGGVNVAGASGTVIGGATLANPDGDLNAGTAPGNVISGNGAGIVLRKGLLGQVTTATTVRGNIIGLSASGFKALPNSGPGVSVTDAVGTVIGGSAAGQGNVISGNDGDGIHVDGANGITIRGNFVGTDPTGAVARGNGDNGIFISNSAAIRIGGVTSSPGEAPGNVISGNGRATHPNVGQGDNGIELGGSNSGVRIFGNLIGTDSSGSFALGNANDGISSVGNVLTDVQIGGDDPDKGNVISANQGYGIDLFSVEQVKQVNNIFGTDLSQKIPLRNGVKPERVSSNNGIFRNNIFGGGGGGVQLVGGSKNRVESNTFNGGDFGIEVDAGSDDVIASNTITGTSGPAISVLAATGVRITRNSLSDNHLGIDLGGDGVTPNDSLGHVGPNHYQNFPVLTSATSFGPLTTVSGTLHSTPNKTFTVEFFANAAPDPSGHGEGQTYLGSLKVHTDANGDAAFSTTLSAPTAAGTFLAATATDASGNTSEFSAVQEVAPALHNTGVDDYGAIVSGNPTDLHYTYQFVPAESSAVVPPLPPPPYAGTEQPTFVAANSHYFPDGPDSRWITIDPNTDQAEPIGFYVFTTHFTVPPGVDPAHLAVVGQWSSDNEGYDVFVNGIDNHVPMTDLVQYGLGFVPFTLTQGFHAGDNAIQFVVFNSTDGAGAINPTAFRVEFTAVYTTAVAPQELGLFATGVDGTGQAVVGDGPDAHWAVTLPGGGPGTPYVAANAAYLPDSGTSRWLTIDPNTNQSEPTGDYTFTTQFTLPAGVDPARFVLYGRWASDNEGAAILVNGQATGVTNPVAAAYQAWAPFTLTGPFQTGVNTLSFVVTNDPGSGVNPVGLRVEFAVGVVGSSPPGPSTSAAPVGTAVEPEALPADAAVLAEAFRGGVLDEGVPPEAVGIFFQAEAEAAVVA